MKHLKNTCSCNIDYTKLRLRILIYQRVAPLHPRKIVPKLCQLSKKDCEKMLYIVNALI
nr:MAG TPA: hypothetical protein [Caudoviricetes sp.]